MAKDKNKLQVFKKIKTFNIYFWKDAISKQEKVKSACWGTMKHVTRWEKRQHKSPLGIHSPAGQTVFSGAGRVDARVREHSQPLCVHLSLWDPDDYYPKVLKSARSMLQSQCQGHRWEIRHRWRVRTLEKRQHLRVRVSGYLCSALQLRRGFTTSSQFQILIRWKNNT